MPKQTLQPENIQAILECLKLLKYDLPELDLRESNRRLTTLLHVALPGQASAESLTRLRRDITDAKLAIPPLIKLLCDLNTRYNELDISKLRAVNLFRPRASTSSAGCIEVSKYFTDGEKYYSPKLTLPLTEVELCSDDAPLPSKDDITNKLGPFRVPANTVFANKLAAHKWLVRLSLLWLHMNPSRDAHTVLKAAETSLERALADEAVTAAVINKVNACNNTSNATTAPAVSSGTTTVSVEGYITAVGGASTSRNIVDTIIDNVTTARVVWQGEVGQPPRVMRRVMRWDGPVDPAIDFAIDAEPLPE